FPLNKLLLTVDSQQDERRVLVSPSNQLRIATVLNHQPRESMASLHCTLRPGKISSDEHVHLQIISIQGGCLRLALEVRGTSQIHSGPPPGQIPRVFAPGVGKAF